MLPAFAEGGQGVGLRRITMDDGLASNAVRNIVQDRAGFVWFGTDNGLCRYDGVRMQPFRIVENGIDQYVSALCDAGDSLVVGTARGVFSFDHRTERFRRIVPEQKGTVTHLAYDKGGNLWVATAEQGAWLLPASGGKAKHYAMDILHGGVSSILVTDDNQIIATSHSTHPSLARLNKVNDRFELLRTPSAADHSALATLQTADGTVWVGTWNSGLMRLDADGKLQQVASAAGPSFRHIHTLHAYAPDCILIGCDEGLLSFNPQTGQVGELRSRLPIPHDFRFVYSVLRDREGGLWVGSFYGGVAYVSPTAGRFDGVAGGVIARFCEDPSGHVWVASDDGGLRLYSPSAKTIDAFTFGGGEHVLKGQPCLYVSNHRDIMLDAALLQNKLVDLGHDTSHITFGANLMTNPLVVDVGKSNKMFRVERPGGSAKEFYRSSAHLSDYIRSVITEERESVWIAQRNGRTKDGNDQTDQGIIKMFCMSMPDNKIEALSQLNIVPVSVSYEWEPCDILKAIELYESRNVKYIKKPGEDLNSILTGILQHKGRVHFQLCPAITQDDLMPFNDCTNNEYHKRVARLIDSRVLSAYRLWPNNYIAHDILYGQHRFADKYTNKEKASFMKRLCLLERYEDCSETLKDIFLGIYANPVGNRQKSANTFT